MKGKSRVAQISHSLRTARRITNSLLEDLPSDGWFHQPVPSGQHALWIVGHLACSDDWGLVALGLTTRHLESLSSYFGGERPVTGDPDHYPPVALIRAHFEQSHQRLLSRLDQVHDPDLNRATSGKISDFAPNLGTLLDSHIWHEGFHTGQLALIRRSLGLPIRWG